MNKPTNSHIDAAQEIAEAFLCQGPVTEKELYCIARNIIAEHFPDWMPIETAPRDGRLILLFGKEISDDWVRGRWDEDIGGWDTDAGCLDDGPSVNENICDGPTHWHPIPPVPIPASPAKKGEAR